MGHTHTALGVGPLLPFLGSTLRLGFCVPQKRRICVRLCWHSISPREKRDLLEALDILSVDLYTRSVTRALRCVLWKSHYSTTIVRSEVVTSASIPPAYEMILKVQSIYSLSPPRTIPNSAFSKSPLPLFISTSRQSHLHLVAGGRRWNFSLQVYTPPPDTTDIPSPKKIWLIKRWIYLIITLFYFTRLRRYCRARSAWGNSSLDYLL